MRLGVYVMPSYPFALQLYSVRDYLERNPRDGFVRVQKSGYTHVELAGNYDLSPLQLKILLEASGLIPISVHLPYGDIIGDTKAVIEQAHTLGVSYVAVPWLGPEVCPDRDAWLTAIDCMNNAGAALAGENLSLCYHNHAHEFERIGNETIFDLIFNNSSPDNLKAELDLGWAVVGKADVDDILKRFNGRVPLVHVKDFKGIDPPDFAELGKGVINWDRILPAAQQAGTKWFIVEQDVSEHDSMESARENAIFMSRLNQS